MTVAAPACVAASADGRSVVSVRGSRALVFDAASLAVIADGVIAAEATAAALLPTRLAMLAPGRLVVHDLPDLATTTTVAVPPRTRLIGTLGDRVVLTADGVALVARVGATGVALEALERPGPVEDVVPLDDDRLLVFERGAITVVAVPSQRVLARLTARVPAPPRLCGAAADRRMIWIGRVGDGDLLLLRLSDGRTFTYRPAAAVDAIYGHGASPWLVVQTARGLERVHVQTLAGHPMAAEVERGACVAGAGEAALCWIDRQGRPRRTPLDGDAVIGGAGLRLTMNGERLRAARPEPDAAEVAAAPPAPAPVVRVGRPRGSASALWRVELADWARALLADPDAERPPPDLAASPLAALAQRAGLDDDGAHALALLYGAWLVGGRRPALATLARLAAWAEIGGDGALPGAGLVQVVGGRASLRAAVARYLDGGTPGRVALIGAGVADPAVRGRLRAHCDPELPLAIAARQVADRLGVAAVTDEARAGGRRGLAIALDEAWLRQRPLIVLPSGGLDLDALAAAPLRADHALVVVWPDSVVPDALASWAALTMAS
ncbi:MAG: hypothetical protein JNK64_38085 [Myxococcales bacterium]|nr:hypothetical protein [Myxococcales bacterium]